MIIDDLSNKDYHRRQEVSNTQLKLMGISPAHFKAGSSDINYHTGRIGTAVHSSVLESWKDVVSIDETRKRSSKADREWWADYFLSEHGAVVDTTKSATTWFEQFELDTGKLVISAEERIQIDGMLEGLDKNQLACDLLKDTESELSVFNDLFTVPCRSRPDASNKNRILDVKSCPDPSAHAFARDCAKFGYHRQDAMYSMMHDNEYGHEPSFYFIAMGKTKPYQTVVYQLNDDAKSNGAYLIERDLQTLKDCTESGNWPGLDNDLDLSIPIYTPEPEAFDMALLA